MKVLVVLLALCVASTLGGLTDEQKAKLRSHKEACIAETGVDPAAVENAKKGKLAENDEKLLCFATCLLQKIGILDAEGIFNEQVFRAKAPADVPKEEVDNVFNSCKGLTGSTLCQTGGAIFKCFLQTKTVSLL